MRSRALLLVALMVTMSLSGCFGNDEVIEEPVVEEVKDPRVFVTDKTGESIDIPAIDMTFQFSDVGETGKEPSIGMTSTGCIFFIAMEKVMRLMITERLGRKFKGLRVRLPQVTLTAGLTQLPTEYSMCKCRALKLHGFVGVMMMGKPGQAIHTILVLPR